MIVSVHLGMLHTPTLKLCCMLKAAHKDNFSHEIKEDTSVYMTDLNASKLATQSEVFRASFELTDTPCTIHDVIKHFTGLSPSQHLVLEQVC